MADPRNPVREVTSRGAISVDEKLTLRSLAAVLAELDIGVALVARPDRSVGIVSERDVVRALAAGAARAGDVMLEDLRLFDVYTGDQVGAGRKSLAYTLRFRAADRTLTTDEASAARDAAARAPAASSSCARSPAAPSIS